MKKLPTRYITIQFRVAKYEKLVIRQKARAAQRTMSAYLREKALS